MNIHAIRSEIEHLDMLLHGHAGGLELVDADDSGTVVVRFTGMCTGCLLRPMTSAATVQPALLRLEGVTEVKIEGSRISDEAARRIARALS
ncbi:NifU-like protein [Paraburkholderia sp. BL23I1N1]|uniref:NifU family protein n=1 Tax=Paraburkholderia sp. BL23I1N1 TaxID=1938802 RepID=UPI000E7501F8|nr:NifU family protein [Paraburkholderia sp. BL23I1N1]RKE38663.1 NifU-like protein [Paraburkholderia sp. BL23I1N1]